MSSCAASAGDSPPYSEWPKSSSTPTLSSPICWMPRIERAAESQVIFTRGSRGLYSMANFRSGWAEASSRMPSTASFQRLPWCTWNG